MAMSNIAGFTKDEGALRILGRSDCSILDKITRLIDDEPVRNCPVFIYI